MDITLIAILGMIAIPFSTILSFCAILLGLFSFDEKRKKNIITNIEKILPTKNKITRFSSWWIQGFFKLFGQKSLSRRQIITIPLLTVTFSTLLFVIWYGWILLFINPNYSIPEHLPNSIRLAVHDFFYYGFWYSLALDTLSIFLARHYIQLGMRENFTSFKATIWFVGSLIVVILLFTLIIHWLRLQAVEDLYIKLGLYFETRPDIRWTPWDTICSSLNLIENETIIIVTSKGWLTNNFIPQSLMFYSSLITQFTLIVIFLCYMTSNILMKTKLFSLAIVKNVGTAKLNAWVFIILAVLMFMFIPLIIITIISLIPTS